MRQRPRGHEFVPPTAASVPELFISGYFHCAAAAAAAALSRQSGSTLYKDSGRRSVTWPELFTVQWARAIG